ncbi:hypothetical protein NLG97_g4084 [Lecanicillium saksenae]|uniref:Uncharacterized protein n=1 Tax=Lecanicillium saksenae TaxID=468837 RepID=A0ACC1QZK2_9HYPO|nr:hypothetical protein NLG97_g4084 [Lecanicillium saksenae]
MKLGRAAAAGSSCITDVSASSTGPFSYGVSSPAAVPSISTSPLGAVVGISISTVEASSGALTLSTSLSAMQLTGGRSHAIDSGLGGLEPCGRGVGLIGRGEMICLARLRLVKDGSSSARG